MASAGNTPIQLFYSNTSGSIPPAANLIIGELAINVPDGKLFYSNNGIISVLASNTTVQLAQSAYSNTVYLQGALNQTNTNIVTANTNLKNYVDGTFLPKTGGTLTGALTINTSSSESLNVSGTMYVGNDLTVQGNIHLSGSSTTYNSNVAVIQDPMIYLAGNNSADLVDIGFYGHFVGFGSSSFSHYQHTGLVRDYTDKKWKLFSNVSEPQTSNSYVDFSTAIYDTLKVGSIESASAIINGVDLLSYTQGINNNLSSNVSYIAGVDATQNTRLGIVETNISYITGVDATQNTRISNLESDLSSNVSYISAVDVTQNTRLSTVETNISYISSVNDTQNTRLDIVESNISYITGVDATQNTNITNASNLAQAAFNKANTATALTGLQPNSILYANTSGYTANDTNNLAFFSANNTLVTSNIKVPTLYTTGGGIVFPDGSLQTTSASGAATDNIARNLAHDAFDKANNAVQTGFVTYNVNGTNLIPSSNNDTLNIIPANNITVSGDVLSNSITIGLPNIDTIPIGVNNPVSAVHTENLRVATNSSFGWIGGPQITPFDVWSLTDGDLAYFSNSDNGQTLKFSSFVGDGFYLTHYNGPLTITNGDTDTDVITFDVSGNTNIVNSLYVGDTLVINQGQNGILKATAGIVTPAVAGVDYGLPTTYLSANTGTGSFNSGETLSITGHSPGIITSVSGNTFTITNNGVSTLYGTTNRITVSSPNGSSTIDLAPVTGLTAGTYTYPYLQVDSYGRVISISNQTPVLSFNGLTGNVTLSSANVISALGYTPVTYTDLNANVSYLSGINTTQNTNISNVTGTAQAAYDKANNASVLPVFQNNSILIANSSGSISSDHSNISYYASNSTLIVANVKVPTIYTSGVGIVFPDGTVQSTTSAGAATDAWARQTANVGYNFVTYGGDVGGTANIYGDLLVTGNIINSRNLVAESDNTIIDSFSISDFRSVKYSVQISDASGFELTELSLLQNGFDTNLQQYNTIFDFDERGTFTANIVSNLATLYFTPKSVSSQIHLSRVSSMPVGIYSRIITIPTDLMTGSTYVDLRVTQTFTESSSSTFNLNL